MNRTASVAERGWAADGLWSGIRRTLKSPRDIALALRIGVFLITVPKALDRQPLHDLLRDIDRKRNANTNPGRTVEQIARLRQAWLASPLMSERNTCYLRALTLYRFLDSRSGALRIHFGVEPGVSANDRIRGHAWVTLNDELLEAPEPVLAGRVRELFVFPADA